MPTTLLLPLPDNVEIISMSATEQELQIRVVSNRLNCCCPRCSIPVLATWHIRSKSGSLGFHHPPLSGGQVGLTIEIAGAKVSWTRETTRVWAADHDDWSAQVAGEACKTPLEA